MTHADQFARPPDRFLYCATCSVRFEVTAMIREASHSDNSRPAQAYLNDRPEHASGWPERWMIHRPDGTFGLYLVNWKINSAGNFQPSPIRIPELKAADGDCFCFAPTREQRFQGSGAVAPMNDALPYLETTI